MWKYRDGTRIEGDGIDPQGGRLTLPSAIVASRRDEIVVEVTYTDNRGNTHTVTGRLDKHHDASDAKQDNLQGTENARDIFTPDENRLDNIDAADVITGFDGRGGDMLGLNLSSQRGSGNEAVILYTSFEDADSDGQANDLVIYRGTASQTAVDNDDYSNAGIVYVSGAVRAVLKDVGTDFRLTNDLVWENATITHRNEDGSYTHDGGPKDGANVMRGFSNAVDIFIIDTNVSGKVGADVIHNFEDGRDKIGFSDNSVTAVYAKVDGQNMVLHSTRDSADANVGGKILAVINGLQATSDDFTTDDFQDAVVTTVEVL